MGNSRLTRYHEIDGYKLNHNVTGVEAIAKLAAYEDMQQEGRFIILPIAQDRYEEGIIEDVMDTLELCGSVRRKAGGK